MRVLLRLLLYTCAVLITSWILRRGVHVENFATAIMVAIALAIINTFIRPVLVFMTIPVTIVTLGFFLLVINGLIIMLIGRIVPGFSVDGFWWALLFSIILSIIASFFGTSSTSIVRRNEHEKPSDNFQA